MSHVSRPKPVPTKKNEETSDTIANDATIKHDHSSAAMEDFMIQNQSSGGSQIDP